MEEEKMKSQAQYELMMGHFILIVVVGMLLTLGAGYFVGKEIGFARGNSALGVITPEYCNAVQTEDGISVKCNELAGVDLSGACELLSSNLKQKIKVVVIT